MKLEGHTRLWNKGLGRNFYDFPGSGPLASNWNFSSQEILLVWISLGEKSKGWHFSPGEMPIICFLEARNLLSGISRGEKSTHRRKFALFKEMSCCACKSAFKFEFLVTRNPAGLHFSGREIQRLGFLAMRNPNQMISRGEKSPEWDFSWREIHTWAQI